MSRLTTCRPHEFQSRIANEAKRIENKQAKDFSESQKASLNFGIHSFM